jgi:S1-C subfamily serine protease
VPQIIATGHAEELGFGVEIDPNQRAERRLRLKGVIILSIQKGTPAEAAGLQGIALTADGITLGDVIVGIGGSPVGSYDDFYNALDEHHVGDELDVRILRAGHVLTVRVKLIPVETSPRAD